MMSPVKQPAGVVALGRLKSSTVEAAIAAGSPQLLLLLDHVQDPGNVGAIIRAAEACGATAVITGPGHGGSLRMEGAPRQHGQRVPLAGRMTRNLDGRHAGGPRCGAAYLRDGASRRNGARSNPLRAAKRDPAWWRGARPAEPLVATADEHLTIPMQPPVESLNVAIAAALILYEASRQRLDVAL